MVSKIIKSLEGFILLIMVFATTSCFFISTRPNVGESPPMPAEASVGQPAGVSVEVVARGLEVPWALDFAPDGRIFVTERPGRIRVISNGVLLEKAWATIAVRQLGESGLMGLALDPNFSNNGYVYVMYNYDEGEGVGNRIVRYVERDGRGVLDRVLIDAIPGATFHDGGRLKIGPDGKLYIATGDATRSRLAQDLGSLAGKILRINLDGTVPDDNPFPDSPVYSYGHRNPQGLSWHPDSGTLYITEHGPTGEGGVFDNDEVNVISPGGNYGWPLVVGVSENEDYVDPILLYNPALAPAGSTFYDGNLFPEWRGDLFFANLRGTHLHRVVFDDAGAVIRLERLFDGVYGRLRDVVVGPDGALYLTTSNRDGRGRVRADDDKILRLLPDG